MSNFKFNQAKKYVMPFGKHKGETIDSIASTDEGLKYLDWLYGEVTTSSVPQLRVMLKIYLEDETIAKELKKLI